MLLPASLPCLPVRVPAPYVGVAVRDRLCTLQLSPAPKRDVSGCLYPRTEFGVNVPTFFFWSIFIGRDLQDFALSSRAGLQTLPPRLAQTPPFPAVI